MKLDNLTSEQYLNLMSPIRVETDKEGKVVTVKDKNGKISEKKIHLAKYVSLIVVTLLRRFVHLLLHSPHQWENNTRLIKHLKESTKSIGDNVPTIKRLYKELKLRLPKQNADLLAVKTTLVALKPAKPSPETPTVPPVTVDPIPPQTPDQPNVINPKPTPTPPVTPNEIPPLPQPSDEGKGNPVLTLLTITDQKKADPISTPPTSNEEKVDSIPVPPPMKKNDSEKKPKIQKPKTDNTFAEELDAAIQKKRLEAIKKSMANATKATPGQTKKIILNKFSDNAQNAVTWLKDATYIEKAKFQNDPSIDVSKVPVLFKKSDLLNNISLALAKKEDQALQDAAEKIKAFPNDYVDQKEVDQFDKTIIKILLRNLQEYVSAFDVRVHASIIGGSPKKMMTKQISQKLLEVNKNSYTDSAGFAFKLGVENLREILAGKILKSLGLNQFYVVKEEVALPAAQLDNTKKPAGIAGDWVVGDDFPMDDWQTYMILMRDLALAEFKGQPSKDLITKITEAEKKIMAFGCLKSIQHHGIVDALLCSGDSHEGQYKRKNGQLYNFDFGRFLTPSAVVKIGNSVTTLLKSVFLDHPAAYLPMDTHLIALIKAMNLDTLEKQNLIGDEAAMKTAALELEQITLDKQHAKKKTALLCKKYNIPYPEKKSLSKLRSHLDAKEMEWRMVCFPKIHPNAFEEMKNRLTALKQYVESTPKPTVKGAFAKMYPLIDPFITVLQRMEINPTFSIGIQHGEVLSFRHLNTLIEKAEANQFATEAELKLMKDNLVLLEQQAGAFIDISAAFSF